MKIKLSLLTAFLFGVFTSSAQVANFTGVKQVYLNNIQPIMENHEVKGYFMFYFVDKANKKENVYNLNILDNSLKETHSIEIIKDKNFRLFNASFNGERFCFGFINFSDKILEYLLLDKTGKTVGTYKVTDIEKDELNIYASYLQAESDMYQGTLIAVPGKGFVRYGANTEGGYRMVIEMFDNNAKKVWSANSGAKATKIFETAQSFYADDKQVVTLLYSKEKMMSSDVTDEIIVTGTSDGKEISRIKLESDKGFLTPMGFTFDSGAGEYILYGEYYAKKESGKIDANSKLGFFVQIFDAQGKKKKENFATWTGDMAKVLPVSSKGKLEDNMSVYIHNVVKTADGKYFFIGEQFKKTVSGLGVASQMLGGGGSMMKIDLHDMMVFEFDGDLKPKAVQIIEKEKVKLELPQGYGAVSVNKLGMMIKMYGWFDYGFTVTSADRSMFNSVYINYDKSGEGSRYVIGNIAYKQKKIVTDKVNLTTKPTTFMVFPAKPGYVAVFEYFRKEKKATIRLEKLDI